MHNCEVLKDGAGSLKVKRRSKGDYQKYEYCLHCKGMFLRAELWRHIKRCPSKPTDHDHQGRKRILGLAAVVKSTCSSAGEEGVLKMLSRMHDDEIASVIRNDLRSPFTVNTDMTPQNTTTFGKRSASLADFYRPCARGLQS